MDPLEIAVIVLLAAAKVIRHISRQK